MTERKLADLESECKALGLTPKSFKGRKKFGKFDYIKTLEQHFLETYRKSGKMTKAMEWIHAKIESPMLALSQNGVDPAEFNRILIDKNYCADVKLDGARIIVIYYPDEGFSFFGRNRSVSDYCFTNYTNQFKNLTQEKTKGLFKKPFVIDGEVTSVKQVLEGFNMIAETQLQCVTSLLSLNTPESHQVQELNDYPLRFNIFDVLMVDEKDLRTMQLKKRLEYLDVLLPAIETKVPGVFLPVERVFGGKDVKDAFYKKVTSAGGEGIVMKQLTSPYYTRDGWRGNKGEHPWVKYKRTVSESVGGDIDVFVNGFKLGTPGTENEGWVAILEFYVLLNKSDGTQVQHHIGSAGNFPRDFMRSLTDKSDPNNPCLKQEIYGRVVTIDGQDISSKSKRFSHCRITSDNFRTDKTWLDCTFEEADLEKLIL